jgi:hypothetical protein
MAYPFPGVSFGDFMKRVQAEFGVSERRSDTALNGPRGPVLVVWLEREVDGQTLRVPKPDLEDDRSVAPWVMGNLCRRLDLDKNDFGYHLT